MTSLPPFDLLQKIAPKSHKTPCHLNTPLIIATEILTTESLTHSILRQDGWFIPMLPSVRAHAQHQLFALGQLRTHHAALMHLNYDHYRVY